MIRPAYAKRTPSTEGTTCPFGAAGEQPEIERVENLQRAREQRRHSLIALETMAAGLAEAPSADEILSLVERVVIEASHIVIELARAPENGSVARRQRRAEWLTDGAEIRSRYPALGDTAALAVFPLEVGTRDFGSMLLAFDSSSRVDAEEWSSLQSIAQLTAVALEAARSRATADREQRLRDELVATLSHELRNPLATIAAVAEALKLVEDDAAERSRWQAALDRQVEQMEELLSELLSFSRLGRADLELCQERVDVAAVLRDAVEDKRAESERRGLTLHLLDSGGSHWVNGSSLRLTQVFHNLLANSIKFTDPPGEIFVTCRRDSDGNVVVTFTDTGIGIEASLLARIFDPFTQGAKQAAESGGGLGLGLALVKRIVARHGGTVSAESAGTGRGATFTVVLPSAD